MEGGGAKATGPSPWGHKGQDPPPLLLGAPDLSQGELRSGGEEVSPPLSPPKSEAVRCGHAGSRDQRDPQSGVPHPAGPCEDPMR